MSLQLSILKVLDGCSGGRASLPELKRIIGLLTTSGPEWEARMKRLAARAPQLDIFGQRLVRRDEAAWSITDQGRAFLSELEAKPDPDDLPEPVIDPLSASEVIRPLLWMPPALPVLDRQTRKRQRPKRRRRQRA